MSRKILFTSGPDLPYWELVKPKFEKYAERIGAELRVLLKRAKNPQWVIFDAMGLTPEGCLGAWIDADIIISDNAPDVFQYGHRLMVCEPRVPQRVHPKWRNNFKKWGVPNMRPYPITAVVAWGYAQGSQFYQWFDDERFPQRWGDQEILALAIWELNASMHFYPSEMHAMLPFNTTTVGNTSFAHAASNTGRPIRKLRALRRFKQMMETRDRV